MRTRTSLLAFVVLGVVLAALGLASWSALASIQKAQQQTLRVLDSGAAYSNIRATVLGEAIAEAGYRRAPSAAARTRLEAAIARVDRTLAAAHATTARRDGPVLANLKLLNQRYVAQVRLTLDTPLAGSNDRVAGPALDAIQRLLEAAIVSHRADLKRATATEIAVANRLRWMLPAAFLLALAVLAWAMRMLASENRRARENAAVATELARTRANLLAEEQRQVAILRDLERSREDFTAMVSHDLLNPLTVIDGYAELLSGTADSPEVQRQAGVIRDRSRQIQRLVGDLGRGAPPSSLSEAVEVDVADVVRDAADAMAQRAAVAGVVLTTQITRASVNGDVDRLRQVADNLLGNAVKYTPSGGEVVVEVRSEGKDAVVRVSDTGIGIPADQVEHVFETYYRASTATSAGLPGTGLGLAITKSIIDGHHGTIRASAIHPSGTCFEVRIPLVRASEEESVRQVDSEAVRVDS